MIQPLRTVLTALFMMSVFCLASCNRNCGDCCASAYDVRCCPPKCDPCSPCTPQCDPCPQACDPCQPNYSTQCNPCPPRCAPQCDPCPPRCAPQPCPPRCAPQCDPCPPACDPCPQPRYAPQYSGCPQACDPCPQPRCAPQCPPPCDPCPQPRCAPQCNPCPPACDPCPPRCPPQCNPCPPVCDPCPPTCDPCEQRARCFPKCGPTPCPSPCCPEQNPYFPCGNKCDNNFPEERCFGRMACYQTCDDCVVDLVQRAPESATVGSPYPIEICITARKECAGVVVNQTLPCDSEFVKSDPPTCPDQNGNLHWEFPHLKQGESARICVWVKPTREGCCLAAATVCACPQLCAYTNCVQPVVCIQKWGPECACLYCPVTYTIDVCNSGSGTAYDVVVQDNVPDGLSHSSGLTCLSYNLGDLCPGESRRICVDFCAVKRGCVTNTATVSFCGGPKCTAEASTIINEPCVEVTKTGPEWAYICKTVDYTITVTNPGDLVLRDVVVDDLAPAGTTIVCAPGAEICCNRALWCIPQLCPGETKTFCISVRSQVCGCLTNKVTVTTQSDCGQCTSCAEASTYWKGVAATHMCMVDTCDPICCGETTVYRICITNRGTCDDHCVRLAVRFTNELCPCSVSGPTRGVISGNTVTFDPIDVLTTKQCVEYAICVKGVAAGDGRAEATLSSEALNPPVTDSESTHVY